MFFISRDLACTCTAVLDLAMWHLAGWPCGPGCLFWGAYAGHAAGQRLGVLDSSSTTLYSYMAYGLGALDIRLYRQKKKRIVYRVPRAPTAVPCTVQYMYSYGCRAVLGFAFM
jgi:hypothetical protein